MRKTSRFLLASLALVTVATGCKPLDDAMVAIFGRSMRDQRTFDPYENPLPPPEGAVAFSSPNAVDELGGFAFDGSVMLDEPYFTQADMMPVGTGNATVQSLVNPFSPDDEAALARGQEIYDRLCWTCHGENGMGAQAPILAKYPALAAFNVAGPQVAGYTDQYIYGMIRVGRGLMPAWGYHVRPIDRWAVVTYVRKLQADAGNGGGE